MRKMLAIVLLTLPSACAGVGNHAPMQPRHGIPGAMNAPFVLEANARTRVKTPSLREVLRDAAQGASRNADSWRAKVDYRDTIDRPDLVADASRNADIARPAYATLQRSFGTGEFRPYVGVGIGQTSARFDAARTGPDDGLTVSGVVGGNLKFTDEVGGYVQYDYAVADENPALANDRESHALRFGLSISLN